MQRQHADSPKGELRLSGQGGEGLPGDPEVRVQAAGGHRDVEVLVFLMGCGVGAAVAQSPQRDASTFRVAAGVEWGAMERARAQWRGHLGTLKPL